MDHEPALDAIRRAVPGLQAVYLFGSRAGGRVCAGSDVDLAVLAASPLESADRWDLQERIATLYGTDVDLVDLRRASTVMRKEVLGSGTVLLDADPPARALFEATALGAYARLQEERKAIIRDARERGTIHG